MKVCLLAGLALTLCLNATETANASTALAQEIAKACTNINWKQLSTDITKGCSCGGKSVDTDTTKDCSCGGKNIDTDTTKSPGCSCGKGVKTDDKAKTEAKADSTKGCSCGGKITKEVLITRICAAVLNNKLERNAKIQYVSPAAHAIPKDAKAQDGGELFIQGAANMLQIVQGGITAHNSGKLENGLPAICNGISGLATLVSRTENPEKSLNELIDFMKNFDATEYERMLHIARSEALRIK